MKTNKFIIFTILFLVLFLAGAFMMRYLQASLSNTTMILGVDLYPRWVGTQAVLNGESPYSQATRQQIWLAIYNSTDTPDGNLFGFYYPPAITTLLMPFVLMGIPVGLAAALWCAFLWAVLSTALLSWTANFRNLPKGLFIIPALLISGWLFRPAFSNYFLGQFALFSTLTAIAAWLAFKNDRPIWAGIFAALSFIKPSLTFIPISLLFIDHWRSPKGILAFIASSLLLYLPPTILLGWWLPDFLADITKYALENRVGWSIIDLGTIPGLLWLLTSITLIGLGMYIKNTLLTFGAAFAFNAVFAPHTADYDLVAFIPLLVFLGDQWLRVKKKRTIYTTLFFALLWFPWLSLFMIIAQSGGGNAVESWYRVIWLTYPPVILLSSFLTQTSTIQAITQKLRAVFYFSCHT